MEEKRERGRRILTEVIGQDYMAARDKSTNEFNSVVRAYSEESCFGDCWNRPGLDRRTRSLILLGMLTALNRPHELQIHVRAAITNGCTVEEIQEALYQTTIYCGLPAAVDSFRIAEAVLKDLGLIDDQGRIVRAAA